MWHFVCNRHIRYYMNWVSNKNKVRQPNREQGKMNIPVLREFSNTLSLNNETTRMRCTSCRSSFLLWSTHTNAPNEDGWIKCFCVHQPNAMLIWKCLKYNERSASYYYYYWEVEIFEAFCLMLFFLVWLYDSRVSVYSVVCCWLFVLLRLCLCFVSIFLLLFFFSSFSLTFNSGCRCCWISRDYKIRNRRTTIR